MNVNVCKCPSMEEWIKKMWYIYTMEYYSAIKKNEVMPFAAIWMDLEIVILSEVRKRRKNIVRHPLYVESKKKWHELTKQKATHRLREQTYDCLYTLLYLKWVSNKDRLTVKHMELYSMLCGHRWEGSLGENADTYMYDWVPSLFIWNDYNIVNWLYPNTK